MRFLRASTIFCAIILASVAFGQGQTRPTAKPQDVDSLDSIMKALYDVISGPAGQKRDWDRFRTLFVADARMGAAYRTPKGDIRYFSVNIEAYIKDDDAIMVEKGFFEKELHRHVDTFGNISQVFSTFESRFKSEDSKPFERGINSIQLMNDGKRWWVVSIYWQSEDDKVKLPDEWLKS